MKSGKLEEDPILDHLAAISVGIYNERCVLDLDYPKIGMHPLMQILMLAPVHLLKSNHQVKKPPTLVHELEQLLVSEKGIMELIDKQKQVILVSKL